MGERGILRRLKIPLDKLLKLPYTLYMSKNKTNKSQPQFGIHFRHNGKWTQTPSMVFTKSEILSFAGANAKRLPFADVLTELRRSVAEIRKQSAKVVRVA